MNLVVYTDGGALGNPGPAAFAYIIYNDKKIIASHNQFIGKTTNNNAEYAGIIAALEKILQLKNKGNLPSLSQINFYSDSRLAINQLNGYFKVKNAAIRQFILKIRALENQINLPVSYHYILREKNRLADSLVKKTLKSN